MAASSLWASANATLQSCASLTSSLPSKAKHLPDMYAEYVASNAHSVGQVESTLRSLTYLLPGARLNDSELASESVHTFVQLLSIYHDHLLKKKATTMSVSKSPSPSKAPLPKPSHHARYTMFWSDSSSLYSRLATILKVIQYTELLLEMTARRRGGERSRWRCVVLLESFKAIIRLVLLRLTNSRPVVTPPLPLREDFAPTQPEEESANEEFDEAEMTHLDPIPFEPHTAFGNEAGIPTPPMSDSDKIPINAHVVQPPHSQNQPHNHIYSPTTTHSLPRTHTTLPTLPPSDSSSIQSYLLSHIITPDDIKPIQQLISRLRTLTGLTAESVYILRPLIYALLSQRLARRYGYEGTKYKSIWSPWLIGVSIEYIARALAKQDLMSSTPYGRSGASLSTLEKEEFSKRGWNLAWWGMRGAFYENVTKGVVNGVVERLKGRPVLDLVGGVVEDYEHLWGTYWASTATM